MVPPTQVEWRTLRRVPGKVNLAVYLIAFVELVERFSYYGATAVFTNFIQRPLPFGSTTGSGGVQSGALGKGQQVATGITTFNSFWVYICPLIGGYIADVHLGRFKTILISIFIALLGHTLLVISAIPKIIIHPNNSLACFMIAIIIMGIGTGGFKPNISPLIAEQIETSSSSSFASIKTLKKNNERVIIDPSLTSQRIFMYFYLVINVGALTGQIGMVYAEKYVGYWLAYLLPTVLFLLCPLVMIFGKKIYVLRPPSGDGIDQAIKVIKLAISNRIQQKKTESNRLGFWDSVKPSHFDSSDHPSKKPKWMTFDDQWIDELSRGVSACKVFLWFPLYWLTYNQISNNLISQAGVMNTQGLPNDLISNLDPLGLIILIPICDLVLYPALRRAGINFTPIKRITAGFFFGSIAMIISAILQHFIYQQSSCGTRASDSGCPVVKINVWAQTPAYIFIVLSEIFASITGLEYAFTLAPKSMRSLVTSIFLFQSAIANAIGEAFNPLSSDPLLVWNYGTMAVLSFIGGLGFYFTHRSLDREHDQMIIERQASLGSMVIEQGLKEDDHELHHQDKFVLVVV